jgi:hypothetical protein
VPFQMCLPPLARPTPSKCRWLTPNPTTFPLWRRHHLNPLRLLVATVGITLASRLHWKFCRIWFLKSGTTWRSCVQGQAQGIPSISTGGSVSCTPPPFGSSDRCDNQDFGVQRHGSNMKTSFSGSGFRMLMMARFWLSMFSHLVWHQS